jgi:hypothetical protein
MTCRTLTLADEVFGPSIAPPLSGRLPVRGEWVGLPALSGEVTTSVSGVNVRTQLTMGSTPDPVLRIAVPAGGGATITKTFPYAASGSGRLTEVTAVRFVSAEFVAVRYTVTPSGVTTYDVSYAFFDLRPRATGAPVPEPVTLGPFEVPLTVQHHFGHNANGQLALFWRNTLAGSAQGKFAEVYRTDIEQWVTAIQPLVSTDDALAEGTIACRVADDGGGSFTVSLHDQAQRHGNAAVVLGTASRELQSRDAPSPGKLQLSARTLSLGPGQTSRSVQVANDGRDFLEVTALTSSNPAITVSSGVTLPVCLLPGESITITISRSGMGAVTGTVTLATTPPATAGGNTVAVTASALTARPAVYLDRAVISWRENEPGLRQLKVSNVGNVPVDIAVPASTLDPPFSWAPVATVTLQPREVRSVLITFTPSDQASVSGTLQVGAFLAGTTTPLPNFPVTVRLLGNHRANVPPGALRIVRIVADPPGNDMLPEGEFIEIANTTGAPLDLTGCNIQHIKRGPAGQSGFQGLIAIGADAFGTDSMLPPVATGATLRVFTRRRAPSDVGPYGLYAGFGIAAWNNTGDTGRILNEFGEEVDRLSYVPRPPPAGTTLPPGTVVNPVSAPHRYPPRRVYVNSRLDWSTVFMVQDGDLVSVTATGTAGFDHWGATSGPAGRTDLPAPAGSPVTGAPSFGLIGKLDGGPPFFVGAAASIPINVDGGPYMLYLGPNDTNFGDNNGVYDCVVVLYR